MKNDRCVRCHEKTWMLISNPSLYESEICQPCYLKLSLQQDPLPEKKDRTRRWIRNGGRIWANLPYKGSVTGNVCFSRLRNPIRRKAEKETPLTH